MLPILFGIISGIVTGLGMGGGTILILLLSLFLNMEQHIAQATNLIFFIPTSIITIIMNIKNKNVETKIVYIVSILGCIGAVIGAVISKNISSQNLKKYFAIFILIIAIHELYIIYKGYKIEVKRHTNY